MERARWTTYTVAFAIVGFCIAPVLYIIFGGFRTNAQITNDPSGLPKPWKLSNYLDVLQSSLFWRQMGNSAIAAIFTTRGVAGLGGMASYVMARRAFRGRGREYTRLAAGLRLPMTAATSH